ncbi:NADH-quinone oxidoreductase subunit NuoF [bacterium]|nr:NADH-quinone oxidoreductase subunit NuoF [bacterium]
MISEKLKERIELLKARYPRKESALMPALTFVQKANNNLLSHQDITSVAEIIGVAHAQVFGVATFYTMYNVRETIGKYHLQIDTNIPATLMGAGKVLTYLENKLGIKAGDTTNDGLFTLTEVECLASCGTCPVIQVNDVYYENMTIEKTEDLIESLNKGVMPDRKVDYYFGTTSNVLLKNRGIQNSTELNTYRKTGGYTALKKARMMTSEEILKEVKESGIRGRGGAGFPAGVKWGFLPAKSDNPVYLICNADEGEPGTFKDRQIMEYDPHLLIEGIVISALAIKAETAFIYVRGEFGWISDILEKAIEEAKSEGLMPGLDIIVYRGAGAYICGEETALIESIEGKRGQPRIKPPFPAIEGLYGCPTIVNNVETLASIPFIIEKGGSEFKKIGPNENNTGFKIFGISGNVLKPGSYECPLGTPFNDLIEKAGGVDGTLKAAIVGGLSVAILTADELKDLNMDYDSCAAKGTALGSGGIMVINDSFSIPELALRAMKFYAHESCGKCLPCSKGSKTCARILKKIVDGYGTEHDLENVLKIVESVNGLTLCPVGEAFAIPIKSMITKFRHEFDALIK